MNKIRANAVRSNSHHELIVWQKSVDLAVETCRAARLLPAVERFGLAAQLRGAAVSIAGNIAEGKGRNQPRDYARFLAMARGSARELDTYFVIARRLDYLRREDLLVAEDFSTRLVAR
jgi:four helix bundle protein